MRWSANKLWLSFFSEDRGEGFGFSEENSFSVAAESFMGSEIASVVFYLERALRSYLILAIISSVDGDLGFSWLLSFRCLKIGMAGILNRFKMLPNGFCWFAIFTLACFVLVGFGAKGMRGALRLFNRSGFACSEVGVSRCSPRLIFEWVRVNLASSGLMKGLFLRWRWLLWRLRAIAACPIEASSLGFSMPWTADCGEREPCINFYLSRTI